MKYCTSIALTLLLTLLITSSAWAQCKGRYLDDFTPINVGGGIVEVERHFWIPDQAPKGAEIVDAEIEFRIFLRPDFVSSALDDFKYPIRITIQTNFGTSTINTLVLSNGKPSQSYKRKLTAYESTDNVRIKVEKGDNAIIPPRFVDLESSDKLVAGEIVLNTNYNFDVRSHTIPGGSLNSPLIEQKHAAFNFTEFQPSCCELELELLKLQNENPSNQSRLKCYSRLNWANATKFRLNRDNLAPVITLAEGSGFYAWRVRKIGYIASSIGPQMTTSAYSVNNHNGIFLFQLNGNYQPVALSDPDIKYFYFADPDSTTNNIFQRVYKDVNGVKEKVTYADRLNNVRQTQVKVPSKAQIVVEETLLDKEQRPAIKSLPVPLDNQVLTYKNNVLVTADSVNVKFSRRHFDSRNQIRKVKPIKAQNDYYNGINNVDNAQGVPYVRKRYANDNSKREVETGLPGIELGFNADNVHTTRNFEATATDDELVKWFGKDAPLGQNVEKLITIDPNGTITTTYKSVDGKVIATAINLESKEDAMLLPLLSSDSSTSSREILTKNASIGNSIIASKPLYLADSGTVKLEYSIKNVQPDTACAVTNVSCPFDVKVTIKRVDGRKIRYCTNGGPDCVYYDISSSSSVNWIIDTTNNQLESVINGLNSYGVIHRTYVPVKLPAGSYMVTKELIPSGNTTTVTSIGLKLNAQVGPMQRLIRRWMDSVKTPCEFDAFLQKSRNLRDSVSMYHKSLNGVTDSILIKKYLKDGLNEHGYAAYFVNLDTIVVPSSISTPYIAFSTKCCPNFTIPIEATFLFTGTPTIVNTNAGSLIEIDPMGIGKCGQLEYQYDFEGYAYKYFYNCIDDNVRENYKDSLAPKNIKGWASLTLSDIKTYKAIYNKYLKRFMPGYTNTGLFNILVYKMLTDSYQIDNSPSPKVHYKADDLMKCWQAQLEVVKQNVGGCKGPDTTRIILPRMNRNVSSGIDSSNNGNSSVHDDAINSNVRLHPILEFFGWGNSVRRKASEDVRNSQFSGGGGSQTIPSNSPANVDFSYDIVENFMECAGYKFARIMTQYDSLPLANDVAPNAYYAQASNWFYKPKGGAPIVSSVEAPIDTNFIKSVGKYRPIPNYFSTNNPTSNRRTGIFTTMRHPVWIYKYQHFPLDSIKEVELSTCFADPNYFYTSTGRFPLCPGEPDSLCNFCSVGKIKCTRDRLSWSSAERYAFFKYVQKRIPGSMTISMRSDGMDGRDYLSPIFNRINLATGVREDSVYIWQDGRKISKVNYDTLIARKFKLLRTDPQRLPTRAEFEIEAANRTMVNAIDAKRPTYRAMLIDSLLAKGYVIDSCVDQSCLNKITQREIDMILDEIVKESKVRSMITTFNTVSDSCRAINTPISFLGHVDTAGNKIQRTEIVLGTGKNDTLYNPVYLNYRLDSARSEFKVDSTLQLRAKVYDPVVDSLVLKDIFLVSDQTPMCQNTLRKQVSEMFMHMVIQPPVTAGLSQRITDTCCHDTARFSLKPDCPTCLTQNQRQTNDFTQPGMPTADSRVRMDMTLNRKRVVSNVKRYQRP